MTDDNEPSDEPGTLLMPSQVARLFRVDPKTVARWAQAGKLTPVRTPGGHRRFHARDIERCLQEGTDERPE